MTRSKRLDDSVEISVIIPCYDEEDALPLTIPPLIKEFDQQSAPFELVLVNNGSHDNTGTIIDDFINQGLPVRRADVVRNEGYGLGVITGLETSRGRIVVIGAADGQIAPEDIVRVSKTIAEYESGVLVKGCRIHRDDGAFRRFISVVFNMLYRMFFGVMTPDVNGVPKALYREDLRRLDLRSKDSFFDSELMIKATYLDFKIIEQYVEFLKRQAGTSKVPVIQLSLALLSNMFRYRFGQTLANWKCTICEKPSREAVNKK